MRLVSAATVGADPSAAVQPCAVLMGEQGIGYICKEVLMYHYHSSEPILTVFVCANVGRCA